MAILTKQEISQVIVQEFLSASLRMGPFWVGISRVSLEEVAEIIAEKLAQKVAAQRRRGA